MASYRSRTEDEPLPEKGKSDDDRGSGDGAIAVKRPKRENRSRSKVSQGSTYLTPAYVATLGFLLSLAGLLYDGTPDVKDIAISLVSGALGMYSQLIKSESDDESP